MATISFLSSPLFKVIGPGKTTFNVHGELLAKKSKVLAKDVNGTMQENETKTIEIEAVDDDIDDDTVMRFLEYVYTGDYPVPDPVDSQWPSDAKDATNSLYLNERSLAEPFREYPLYEPPSPVTYISGSGVNSKGRGKSRGQKGLGWQADEETCTKPERDPKEPQPSPFVTTIAVATRRKLWEVFCDPVDVHQSQVWLPPSNNDEREDFTLVFLCHARLYKFADRYHCPELVSLSLRRLRLTLSRYFYFEERASAVVELIRYTYQHTMEFEQSYDKLRLLVLDYATCWIQELSGEESLIELMKEPGPLASDLLLRLVGLFQGGSRT